MKGAHYVHTRPPLEPASEQREQMRIKLAREEIRYISRGLFSWCCAIFRYRVPHIHEKYWFVGLRSPMKLSVTIHDNLSYPTSCQSFVSCENPVIASIIKTRSEAFFAKSFTIFSSQQNVGCRKCLKGPAYVSQESLTGSNTDKDMGYPELGPS
jgi:hypothetical protein